MASLRITGDLGLWNESGPCDSLIVENNTFEDCVYGGNGAQSIIMIDPQYASEEFITGKYSRDIIIKDNDIKTFDSSILLAISVDGLVFEDNRIRQTDTYQPIFPDRANIKIVNCNGVSVKNNTYTTTDGDNKGTIQIDEKTTNIKIDKQSAFFKHQIN
jgi:hypothetical protein